MWSDLLANTLQGKSYQIMRSNLINMPKLYNDPDENKPEKVSKAAGVSANKKHVDFNLGVHMKRIPKTTGVQTKSVKSTRHVK